MFSSCSCVPFVDIIIALIIVYVNTKFSVF
nr:MAG TPA: hypothetical protein [Caudoviricetes sp.]